MVRYCLYRYCKNRDKPYSKKNLALQTSTPGTICFFPVPKPTTEYEKCVRWLLAINRPEIKTTDVKKHHYVCSNHFVGGLGPTIDNPDPISNYEEYLEFEELQTVSMVTVPFDNICRGKFETPIPSTSNSEVKEATPVDFSLEENIVIESDGYSVLRDIAISSIGNPGDKETSVSSFGNPRDKETSVPSIGNPGDKETSVPSIGNPGDKKTSVPSIANPGDRELSMPTIGNSGDKETSVPSIGNPGDRELSIPTIGNSGDKETSVPSIGNPGDRELSIPTIGNLGDNKTSVPTFGNAGDRELSMPTIGNSEDKETSVPSIGNPGDKETSVPSIKNPGDRDLSIPTIGNSVDREMPVPPIESLGHLAKDFLNYQLSNLESIKWSMETKHGTAKNINHITSLMFKNCEFMKVILKPTLIITVTICDREIPDSHVALNSSSVNFQEPIKSLGDLIDILFELESWNCCQGIQGELFVSFSDRYLISVFVCSLSQSLRSEKCQSIFLEENKLCQNCRLSKRVLERRKQREKKRLTTVNPNRKFTNIRFLDSEVLRKKYDSLYTKNSIQKRKIKQMEEKIKKSYQKDGIFMTQEESADFEEILHKNPFHSKTVFQKLFLREQIKLNASKKSRPRKWHPALIQWCLSIKARSSTTYEALRQAIPLPSKRTLFNYSVDITSRSGFDEGTLLEMSKKIDLDSLEEHQKHFSLILDEIQVKQDLVFRSNSGELIGATNLNTFRNRVAEIEKQINICTEEIKNNLNLATHILQLMVRGITTNFKYAYAYFPCDKLRAEDLYSILWEAIEHLQGAGFKIISVVCDKAATNQKLIKFCTESEKYLHQDEVGYRCKNPFNNFEPLYFISDVCHCVKTAKNGLAHSGKLKKHKDGVARPIRLLKKNGKYLLWKHVVDTFERDSSSLLKLAPKLTYNHVYPNAYSCMKVKLCVQVLSSTTANAMEELVGSEASETVKFLRIFDHFFDVLNVSNCSNVKRKLKPALAPFISLDDWRFEWLRKDFLGYLDEWETEVNMVEVDDIARSKMLLSRETLEGLRITVYSTIDLTKYMLKKGAPLVLTAKFNQDPVEQYFSKQRAACGAGENPTVSQYGQGVKRIKLMKSLIPKTKNGNCSKTIEKRTLRKKTARDALRF